MINDFPMKACNWACLCFCFFKLHKVLQGFESVNEILLKCDYWFEREGDPDTPGGAQECQSWRREDLCGVRQKTLWGAGMVQWWEEAVEQEWHRDGEQVWRSGESARLPPSGLGLTHSPAVTCGLSFCRWSSSLLREVFLRVLRFSPLLKNQHFQIPIRSRTRGPQVCQSQTVTCHPP